MTLIIEKETARRLYEESKPWFREKLIKEFGEAFFNPPDFRSIKSYEDACAALVIDPVSIFQDGDTPDELAYKKLKIIIKAVNQGWTPDWKDGSQLKWRPWFVLSSGFDFSYSYYYYSNAYTTVGSRLCFESEEKSDYVATQFLDLYKQFLT